MNIIEINKSLVRGTQRTLNCLSVGKYILLDSFKYKKITKKNEDLRECARTKQCYVVGNGPSLKAVDMSLLKGKDIITVNKSIRTSIFDELKPKFHVVIDRFIMDDIADDIERELQRKDSETIIILHRSGISRFGKYDRARFVYGTRQASSPKSIKIDMTKNMTTYLNVLPFATECALFFGYKEIILLGNDFSFFASRKDQHFYDFEEKKDRSESLYSDLAGCSIVLLEYRSLYEYAKKNGINIVNATEGSLLDEIPQRRLSDYVSGS